MREDIWINCKTNTELGINTGTLGSPRAWLRRAYDVASLDVVTFSVGALTPYEISVAAVWYRPSRPMPGTQHRELYRFFDIAQPNHLQRSARNVEQNPAIGVAVALPMTEILPWIAQAKAAGAAYTWWKTPNDKSIRAVITTPRRRQLDHSKIYQLCDQGLSRGEIATQLDYPINNVDYVVKKWAKGIALSGRQPYVDHAQVVEDWCNGMKMAELEVRYQRSRPYLYDIIKKAAPDVTNTTYNYS